MLLRRRGLRLCLEIDQFQGSNQDQPQDVRKSQPFFQVNYHTGVHWNRTIYLQELMESGFRSIEASIGRFSFNTNMSIGLSYSHLIHDPENNPFNDMLAYPAAKLRGMRERDSIPLGWSFFFRIFCLKRLHYKMILELLKRVCKSLDEHGFPYMITGSIALNVYSIPRMTRDIDIVIELPLSRIDEFIELFPDSYMSESTIVKEIKRQGLFNIIDHRTGFKLDNFTGGPGCREVHMDPGLPE